MNATHPHPELFVTTAIGDTLEVVLEQIGVQNTEWYLKIADPDLEKTDGFTVEELLLEPERKLWKECQSNPWFFFRNIILTINGKTFRFWFDEHRVLFITAFLTCKHIRHNASRQQGLSTMQVAAMLYDSLFHSPFNVSRRFVTNTATADFENTAFAAYHKIPGFPRTEVVKYESLRLLLEKPEKTHGYHCVFIDGYDGDNNHPHCSWQTSLLIATMLRRNFQVIIGSTGLMVPDLLADFGIVTPNAAMTVADLVNSADNPNNKLVSVECRNADFSMGEGFTIPTPSLPLTDEWCKGVVKTIKGNVGNERLLKTMILELSVRYGNFMCMLAPTSEANALNALVSNYIGHYSMDQVVKDITSVLSRRYIVYKQEPYKPDLEALIEDAKAVADVCTMLDLTPNCFIHELLDNVRSDTEATLAIQEVLKKVPLRFLTHLEWKGNWRDTFNDLVRGDVQCWTEYVIELDDVDNLLSSDTLAQVASFLVDLKLRGTKFSDLDDSHDAYHLISKWVDFIPAGSVQRHMGKKFISAYREATAIVDVLALVGGFKTTPIFEIKRAIVEARKKVLIKHTELQGEREMLFNQGFLKPELQEAIRSLQNIEQQYQLLDIIAGVIDNNPNEKYRRILVEFLNKPFDQGETILDLFRVLGISGFFKETPMAISASIMQAIAIYAKEVDFGIQYSARLDAVFELIERDVTTAGKSEQAPAEKASQDDPASMVSETFMFLESLNGTKQPIAKLMIQCNHLSVRVEKLEFQARERDILRKILTDAYQYLNFMAMMVAISIDWNRGVRDEAWIKKAIQLGSKVVNPVDLFYNQERVEYRLKLLTGLLMRDSFSEEAMRELKNQYLLNDYSTGQ